MTATLKELLIETENGQTLVVNKFVASKTSKHTIVISSATGVLQQYYSKFAHFCATHGVTVYTFDYSGIGKSVSSTKALKKYTHNMKSWGQNDQAAIVAFAKKENPDTSLSLVTHSLGGQLLGFNPNYHLIDKVIMVASQSGYWKDYKGTSRFSLWSFWHVLIPVLTPIFGYFPAKKLGLFENLPKFVVYQWASWGKKKNYFMHFKNEEYLFDKFEAPILSWSFSKDPYANKQTVDWLAQQYENAQITRIHYPEKDQNQPGHFGFFKTSFKELLWKQNLNWIITDSLS